MKIAFTVDGTLIVVLSAAGLVGLFALHAAFPGLYDYWPKASADLASWMQAIGAVAAIGWSGRIASQQIAVSREQTAAQIAASHKQTALQIDAAYDQARAAQVEARNLADDLRRVNHLLKVSVLAAIFENAIHHCERVRRIHEEVGFPMPDRSDYEHVREASATLRQLPLFELPGEHLAVFCIKIARDLNGVYECSEALRSDRGSIIYRDGVRRMPEQLRVVNLMLEEAIRVCREEIEELSLQGRICSTA
ncbi:MAG: hypothetical protein O9337_17410 [Acidovorax sp.]|uniref:hypothetical protein n=1 Tax=Acidovorax sp. TaxID=1872122 RepID=UPI0022CC99E5|nr:hypothetical protein [Acidovorax sp.]MCZ8221197.1 hypothetical protein [Acidovorax sp.]